MTMTEQEIAPKEQAAKNWDGLNQRQRSIFLVYLDLPISESAFNFDELIPEVQSAIIQEWIDNGGK